MTIRSIRVSDSITLSAIQTDRFKTGVLTFTLLLPLSPESTALHILLSGMMRRGTKTYPSVSKINRRLDTLYATDVEIRSTKLGKNLLLTITAEMLDPLYTAPTDQLLRGVIEVIAELLLCPVLKDGIFDESAVEQEIRFASDALAAEINNTRAYAVTRCAEWMNRLDPQYPTVKSVKQHILSANANALTEHYKMLLSSSPIDVFYIGSVSPDVLADELVSAFSALPTGTTPFSPIPLSSATPCEPISKTEQMPVSQGKLAMGFRTGICATADQNKSYSALLLNEIFGGSPASKLFLNVREKMSLCYYCSSSYSIYTGDIMVSSGIEVKNRAVAEEAIRSQMEAICHGQITDAEMHAAKKSLENCYRQLYDNPLELQAFYSARALFGMTETIDECCERVDAVSMDDVVSLANRTVCDTVFFVEGTKVASLDEAEDSNED